MKHNNVKTVLWDIILMRHKKNAFLAHLDIFHTLDQQIVMLAVLELIQQVALYAKIVNLAYFDYIIKLLII